MDKETRKSGLMDEYKQGTRETFQEPKRIKPTLKVIDTETGEIKDDGYRITRKATDKQKIMMSATAISGIVDELGWFWTMIYDDTEQMPLNDADYGRLIYLMTYVSYFDEHSGKAVLQYDNGTRLTRKHIQKLLGVSDSVFKTFMANIQRHEFIGKIPASEGGGFQVNPKYFKRGVIPFKPNENERIFRTFRKVVRDIYQAMNNRQHRFLGIVYKLLRYVHFSQNIVAQNPTVRDKSEIIPMSLAELAEVIGYENARDVKRQLMKIVIDGRPLFKFYRSNDYKDEYIIVSPFVVYAGKDDEMTVLRTMFSH